MNDASTRPAVLGGPKAVTLDASDANRWPILTAEDEQAACAVLRDGELSLHPVTRELENDYREYLGMPHALAHCNGTAALLAAFFALELEPGDEVLVPSATFWASVVPMLWLGAIPVFCESEPRRLGLDPDDVERKITPRTRAVVVIHLWGMPCRMTRLRAIAKEHGLKIIEDASHALGASWRDRRCGSLGDISVISLQGDKLAPAGEGGMFLTRDDAYMERATCMGDIMRILELQGPSQRFAGTSFGIKTRMAPLCAAVARTQFRHLPERMARRTKNLVYLSQRLEELGFDTYLAPSHVERVYFEFIIRYDEQRWNMPIEVLVKALQAEGCSVDSPRYPLLHQQPLFTEGRFADIARLGDRSDVELPVYRPDALPITEAASREFLRLPTFSCAEPALLDQYADAFEKTLGNADAILKGIC